MKNDKKLDKEEQDILSSFENGEWVSTFSSQRSAELKNYAKHTLAKDKKVNFRISSADLDMLRARALKEGLPYQTLIASVIHKFITGYYD